MATAHLTDKAAAEIEKNKAVLLAKMLFEQFAQLVGIECVRRHLVDMHRILAQDGCQLVQRHAFFGHHLRVCDAFVHHSKEVLLREKRKVRVQRSGRAR